jgi:hypothetical protein
MERKARGRLYARPDLGGWLLPLQTATMARAQSLTTTTGIGRPQWVTGPWFFRDGAAVPDAGDSATGLPPATGPVPWQPNRLPLHDRVGSVRTTRRAARRGCVHARYASSATSPATQTSALAPIHGPLPKPGQAAPRGATPCGCSLLTLVPLAPAHGATARTNAFLSPPRLVDPKKCAVREVVRMRPAPTGPRDEKSRSKADLTTRNTKGEN